MSCAGRDCEEEVDEAGAGVREPKRLPIEKRGYAVLILSYVSDQGRGEGRGEGLCRPSALGQGAIGVKGSWSRRS